MFLMQSTQSAAPSADFETKFIKYLAVLKERGYFAGAAEGTPQYIALVEKARTKLLERSEGGSVPAQSASFSSSPSTDFRNTNEEIDPETKAKAEELKTQGNQALTQKNMSEAVRLYTEAIALVPNNAVYYANRAAAHSQSGNHYAAVEDSKKAIAIDPNYPKAYSRLGLAYFALERYQEAIDEGYEKALKLEPNNQLTKDSLSAARKKLTETTQQQQGTAGPTAEPSAGTGQAGATGGGFGNLLQNLMGSLGGGAAPGGAPGSAAPGGAPGGAAPDFAGLMSNPNFMQMAQQMAQSPQFQQMAQQVASNPDILNNLGSMFGARPPQ